jgi:hypothetical protein
MTEIQLRRIVDRNAQEEVSEQQSDGDERMVKDGQNIRKFSKEAMTLARRRCLCLRGQCIRDITQSLHAVRYICRRGQSLSCQKWQRQES